MILLSFLAFWMLARNGLMYFNAKDILFNEAGFTGCMVIPVIIASYMLFPVSINKPLLRVMSFVGIYFGLMNMLSWFVLNRLYWWMGIVHIPLLINSIIGFIYSLKIERVKLEEVK